MTKEKKMGAVSLLLSTAALAVYLAVPPPTFATGSGCYYDGRYFSNGACFPDPCFWPWDGQECAYGNWLPCGSC